MLDILERIKEHEEKGVLEQDETESLTDVMMEQKECLLTDGLVLQAKPKTENLMMSEPSRINEQVQGVEMLPVGLMDQVPRPSDLDDELLDQEAIVAGNVAVGGEQASMGKAMIEGVQGQGQMVEQCGDVMVVEADNSVVALCKAYFGPGPGSILLDNTIGVQNNLHTEDAGVKCGGKVM
ncbi:hypothetical protein EMCRGX_G030342 [Ephydatia muelleri]